jgi:hypothetical protein
MSSVRDDKVFHPVDLLLLFYVPLTLQSYHPCDRMKLPVPPGFVITTETCLEYFHGHRQITPQLIEEYTRAVHELERQTGRKFPSDPTEGKSKGKCVCIPLLSVAVND